MNLKSEPAPDDTDYLGRNGCGIAADLTLPPTDRGQHAWLTLAACSILEALVWGFPFAFGVFQEYYARQEAFADQLSSISAIGTTATGVMYCSAPLVYDILRRFPDHRKIFSVAGYIILLASVVGASFANTAGQLLATQGITYAIGGSFHYFPAFLYLDEWFVERKGLAYGIFIAGAGASGVAIPFAMEWILNTWGFRTALRTWALISFVLTTPAFFFMKTRQPDQYAHRRRPKLDLTFLKSPALWILLLGNAIQSIGYFMPLFYIPSFAVTQGWSSLSGTIAVALCSAANALGATCIGWLVDRYDVTVALNLCAAGTTTATFLFWGFAVHEAMLYVFAFLYGFFAGGFPATWSGCGKVVQRTYRVEMGMIISLFTASKGIGSVISGPIGGALVAADAWAGARVGYAYGSGYGYVIVLTGVTASFTTLGWMGKKYGVV
ncbi:major facilitator superfamily domain-containing protein [Aspergillus bertholletiae]|uniref:Major facilitator superfamily domain-containing protein n=1 Tax=Aspergillus bertholletiae TaxID=1226010 RepID=A0A5N7BPF1_9EURO|nr:major facilitator superfamily domain-containing protein [Aspergillus bertholletiae]